MKRRRKAKAKAKAAKEKDVAQKAARGRKGGGGRKAASPKHLDINLKDLRAIVGRAASGPLKAEDVETLGAAVDTLAYIQHELEHSGVSTARLKKILFGPSSEKTRVVLGEGGGAAKSDDDPADPQAEGATPTATPGEDGEAPTGANATTEDKKPKGHGRRAASTYTGARKVRCRHGQLESGDSCPECLRGKVSALAPAVMVRVCGVAPLEATVYERDRLRCNLCGKVFKAPSPPGVGEQKYDATAAAMIALLKYGCGLPFHRLERLGDALGMPLPASTQWEVVEGASDAVEPAWAELVNRAADGDVVHIDDTNYMVLSLAKQIKAEKEAGKSERTGIFTSGVVSTSEGRQISIFFTGREHAGENLDKVLAQRSEKLSPPILMCDALSRNTSSDQFDRILANCLTHGRRKFVDLVEIFPNEVARVLNDIKKVYQHDAKARDDRLSPAARLAHHQEHSKPVLDGLKTWLDRLINDKEVEPNSSLGGAIRYLQNHWEALTLFLRVPGAPLDNNICERFLKRAILQRKNSLFYKTENGARVGDMFLSVIHTAELCKANPFDYLVALQRNSAAVAAAPSDWLPWNYVETRARLESAESEAETG